VVGAESPARSPSFSSLHLQTSVGDAGSFHLYWRSTLVGDFLDDTRQNRRSMSPIPGNIRRCDFCKRSVRNTESSDPMIRRTEKSRVQFEGVSAGIRSGTNGNPNGHYTIRGKDTRISRMSMSSRIINPRYKRSKRRNNNPGNTSLNQSSTKSTKSMKTSQPATFISNGYQNARISKEMNRRIRQQKPRPLPAPRPQIQK
jgi:hypothetical protein